MHQVWRPIYGYLWRNAVSDQCLHWKYFTFTMIITGGNTCEIKNGSLFCKTDYKAWYPVLTFKWPPPQESTRILASIPDALWDMCKSSIPSNLCYHHHNPCNEVSWPHQKPPIVTPNSVIFTCPSRLTNSPNNTMYCQLGAKSWCIGDKCLHQLSYGPEATLGTMRGKQYSATYHISWGRSQLVNNNCSTPWLLCYLQIRSENRHLMI